MRIKWSSESNKKFAKALHSSVLPTPVGPKNKKLPYGRFGSPKPLLERRMASETKRTASSWPTTRSCSLSSIFSSFSRSPVIILLTGMPVARLTTSAISSAPTSVRSILFFCAGACSAVFSTVDACFNCASSCGNLPYCNSETFCHSPLRVASSISNFIFSMASLIWLVPCTWAFSAFQISSKSEYSLVNLVISSSIKPKRLSELSSFSRLTASRSIFNWINRRSNLSKLSGLESISILMREAASSIKSMALSGKNRSVM